MRLWWNCRRRSGIRILKDLSDIKPPDIAADRLEALLADTTSLAVVCAMKANCVT